MDVHTCQTQNSFRKKLVPKITDCTIMYKTEKQQYQNSSHLPGLEPAHLPWWACFLTTWAIRPHWDLSFDIFEVPILIFWGCKSSYEENVFRSNLRRWFCRTNKGAWSQDFKWMFATSWALRSTFHFLDTPTWALQTSVAVNPIISSEPSLEVYLPLLMAKIKCMSSKPRF